MKNFIALQNMAGTYTWQGAYQGEEEEARQQGVRFSIHTSSQARESALAEVATNLADLRQNWLCPLGSPDGAWTVHLDKLPQFFPTLAGQEWLRGDRLVKPEFDVIDWTIGGKVQRVGVVRVVALPEDRTAREEIVQRYAFIAMPMTDGRPDFDDVHDAIKEAANRCGIQAERVDEPHSTDRITDRILESIQRAEYVIADLTEAKPNVYFEAGYAHALRKTPIYIARRGTQLGFDLKDYPVIFFDSLRQLKDGLERRLRGLAEARDSG